MPISLTQGLGAGLVNVAGAYQQAQQAAEDRRRKMEREDTQAEREDQVWQERGENQDVAGMAAEQNLLAHTNDQDPFYQTEQFESQMSKDPVVPPVAQNKPNPAGIATVPQSAGSLAPPPVQMARINLGANVQGKGALTVDKQEPESGEAEPGQAPVETPTKPGVPPPTWKGPADPEAKALHDKYLARNTEMKAAMAKIHEAADGDEAKEKRMLAAYAKLKQPELEKADEEFKAYGEKVQARVASLRASKFVDDVYETITSGNQDAIHAKFGKNSYATIDPKSGLPVVMINGRPLGQEMIMAKALLHANLIDGKEYGKMSMDYAKIYANAMKEQDNQKRQDSIAARGARNQTLDTANDVQKNAEELFKLKNPKATPDQIKQAGLEARQRHLTQKEDHTANVASAAEQRLKQKGKNELMNRARYMAKDIMDKDPLGGERKVNISSKTALTAFKTLQKEDPDAAMLYRELLNDQVGADIDSYVGINPPKEEKVKPDAGGEKKDAKSERDLAASAIAKNPAKAAAIKAKFKERTGQDY